MTRFAWLLPALWLLSACAPAGNDQNGASARLSPAPTPQGNFFYGLPTFCVGETAEFDGFSITLTNVDLDGPELSLTLELQNDTESAVDLNWAVQLHHRQAGYVLPDERPDGEAATLAATSAVSNVWRYDLRAVATVEASAADGPSALADYLLLYAPQGWSGPVMVYRLDTLP